MSKQLTELLVTVTGKAFGVLVEEVDAISVRREFVRYVDGHVFETAPRYVIKFFKILKDNKLDLGNTETELAVKVIRNWYWFTVRWMMPTYYGYIVELMAVTGNAIGDAILDLAVTTGMKEIDDAYGAFVQNADITVDKKQYTKWIVAFHVTLRNALCGMEHNGVLDKWMVADKISTATKLLR
jgi:hypothetical protein